MVGMLFNVARQVVQPTLGRIFVENAIHAAGHAAGAATVAAAAYVAKRQFETSDRKSRNGNGRLSR